LDFLKSNFDVDEIFEVLPKFLGVVPAIGRGRTKEEVEREETRRRLGDFVATNERLGVWYLVDVLPCLVVELKYCDRVL
jgi:hypothetical protein